MPAVAKRERPTTHPGSDLRQLIIQYNALVNDLNAIAVGLTTDQVLSWSSAITASAQALGRGSTDTNIGSGALQFRITGQAATEAKAAVAAGTAIGAQTVPADTWAVYALDIATGGTITVSAGAANATTGYSTEALAIAACPARVTAKARMGYVTVKTKAATAWVAATDGLAGGSSGNIASATNYYPFDGVYAPTGTPSNCALGGTWNGGRNGVVVPTVLSRGSTDTNLATTAFTYNANGIVNLAKAAVAAGTAFGALGTISADTWGVIAVFISTAGTISFASGAGNYSGDYKTEAQAIAAVNSLTPTASNCFIGYVTIKTKAATAFVVGTDALAGGATGNVASGTNYYPVAGISLATSGPGSVGMTAAQLASRDGTVFSSAQY